MSQAALAVQSSMPGPRVDRSKLVMTALCTAMVDLVFKPPVPASASMVPTLANLVINDTVCSSPSRSSSCDSGYPETLYLDHARLHSYVNDASDLLGLYMLVMLFRQLTTVNASGVKPAPLEDWEIDRVKREVWEVGPSRLGMCFDVCLGVPNGVNPADVEAKWKKGMNDVVLQVGMRAEEAREKTGKSRTTSPVTESKPTRPPNPETLTLVDNWMRSNYKKGSPLQVLMKERLRNAVLDVVKENVLGTASSSPVNRPVKSLNGITTSPTSRMRKVNHHAKPGSAPLPPKSAGTGLEPLMPEILHLGERIARLVSFHGKVYRRLYEVEGFLQLQS